MRLTAQIILLCLSGITLITGLLDAVEKKSPHKVWVTLFAVVVSIGLYYYSGALSEIIGR